MENRKVYLDDHTNLLQLEEHVPVGGCEDTECIS